MGLTQGMKQYTLFIGFVRKSGTWNLLDASCIGPGVGE
jgi:hypothetical protein